MFITTPLSSSSSFQYPLPHSRRGSSRTDGPKKTPISHSKRGKKSDLRSRCIPTGTRIEYTCQDCLLYRRGLMVLESPQGSGQPQGPWNDHTMSQANTRDPDTWGSDSSEEDSNSSAELERATISGRSSRRCRRSVAAVPWHPEEVLSSAEEVKWHHQRGYGCFPLSELNHRPESRNSFCIGWLARVLGVKHEKTVGDHQQSGFTGSYICH